MDGPALNRNIGRLHQGTSRCVIGALPVSYTQEDAPSSETINGNITAFVAPGLQLKYVTDGNYKALVHIPITEDNEYNDSVFTVTMISDDRAENYWTFHRYMETIQSGKTDGVPVADVRHRVYGNDGQYRNRRTWIPYIEVHMADDSFQRHQIIRYERCYPLKVSDLDLNFMGPSPVKFTMSFLYSLKRIIRMDPPQKDTTPNCIVNK
jgi:hypothetical protein